MFAHFRMNFAIMWLLLLNITFKTGVCFSLSDFVLKEYEIGSKELEHDKDVISSDRSSGFLPTSEKIIKKRVIVSITNIFYNWVSGVIEDS